MTVDTVAKIVEGEKCGLDMSSYENLNSSPTSPTNVGGNGGGNGDGKDDYVFVNDSDAGSSDDHGERNEIGEVNVGELVVDGGQSNGQLGIGNVVSEKMENGFREDGDKIDGGEVTVENGVGNLGEEGDSGGGLVKENGEIKVENGEIKVENGEIKVGNEVVEVEKGRNLGEEGDGGGGFVKENGEIKVENDVLEVEKVRKESDLEGGADVVDRVSEDVEGGHSTAVVEEGKDEERVFEDHVNGNGSVDDLDSQSADVGNDICDVTAGDEVSSEVEGQGSPSVGSVPDAEEAQEAVSFNGTSVVEVPVSSDAEDQGLHLSDALPEQQDLQPANGELEDLNLNEAQPEIREQGDVDPMTGGESQEFDSVDLEAAGCGLDQSKLAESKDHIDPDFTAESVKSPVLVNHQSEEAQSQNDLDSADPGVASINEDPSDESKTESESGVEESVSAHAEIIDEAQVQHQPVEDPVLLNLSSQSEEAQVQANSDSATVGTEGPAVISVGQSDESKSGLESGVEEVAGAQSDTTDEAQVQPQPEENCVLQNLSCESGEAQIQANSYSSAPGEEDPDSVSVVQSVESQTESESGLQDSVRALRVDEQSDLPNEVVVKAEPNMVDGSKGSELTTENGGSPEASLGEDAFHDQVAEQTKSADVIVKEASPEDHSSEKPITVNNETDLSNLQLAEDSVVDNHYNDHNDDHVGDGVPEHKGYSVMEVVVASDPDMLKEQGLAAVDISQNGSADDAKSETKSLNDEDEAQVVVTANNVSDVTSQPKISFGSLNFGTTFTQNDDSVRTNILNKSTAFSTRTLNTTVNSANDLSSVNHGPASAQFEQAVQIDELPASHVEVSEAESFDDQNVNPDLVRSPFYWLIKVPYFENFKEQITENDAQVQEKARIRDALIADYQKKKASVRELKAILGTAKSEEKIARELMMAKKREADSTLSLINLAKHVVDLDAQLFNLEHRVGHHTNTLKEEKLIVREINQLKQHREQLSANSRRQQEVKQALDQREELEDKLKVLKKELEPLKENLSKAMERSKVAQKKFDEESVLLNEFHRKMTFAKNAQQEAYTHHHMVKKESYEKNKYAHQYRDALRIAKGYADTGKNDMLERYCINHVDKIMELWNKNDEFRKNYVLSNKESTLRRLKTMDGRGLGPDEEPQATLYVQANTVNFSAKARSGTPSNLERDFAVEGAKLEDHFPKIVVETKTKPSPAKLDEATSKNGLAEVSGRSVIEEGRSVVEEVKEEEINLAKEEEELAKKAEQLRKEEEASRLREQRRLEEKLKAQEALERKKRLAEKAQARAEFKAQKEAEAKEKEREKRAKKKEQKKGLNPETTVDEVAQISETSSETVKEAEIKTEKPATVAKRPSKAALHTKPIKTTKPIPPALRNKGKRGLLLQLLPYVLLMLLAIAVFFLGDMNTISDLKQFISRRLYQ